MGTTLLDGTWQLVRAELAGEAAPELVTTKTLLEFHQGGYLVRFDGVIADRGLFEIGAEEGARTIVLRGAEGPNAGRTIPAIYQHVGERLRVCYGLDGVVPAEFTAPAGQPRYLATYRLKRSST